jgi:hypothetical protein
MIKTGSSGHERKNFNGGWTVSVSVFSVWTNVLGGDLLHSGMLGPSEQDWDRDVHFNISALRLELRNGPESTTGVSMVGDGDWYGCIWTWGTVQWELTSVQVQTAAYDVVMGRVCFLPENPSQFLVSGKEEINVIDSCIWLVLKECFSCLQERQALLDSEFLGWSSHPETMSKLSLEGWAWLQFIWETELHHGHSHHSCHILGYMQISVEYVWILRHWQYLNGLGMSGYTAAISYPALTTVGTSNVKKMVSHPSLL